MGDTEDLVHVERVEDKSKQTKFNLYTPSDPIKITHEHNCSHLSNSNNYSNSNSFNESDDLVKVISLANMEFLAISSTTHCVRKMPHLESWQLQL